MTKVLVIAEHDGRVLNLSTARAIACAQGIAPDAVDVAVFARGGDAVAEAAAGLQGVARVLLVDAASNEHPIASLLAPQIVALASDYSHLLAPGTTFGKDLMPRVAAALGAPQISDIMRVHGPMVFERPVYAGNAVTTVEAPPGIVVGTVRSASFAPVPEGGSAPVERTKPDIALPSHTRFIGLESHAAAGRPDLQSAARVVSGGRGVGSKENFELIYRIADKLGAAVGASRAAVDAGFVPNDMQVGQTGKIIAPDLYIAFGISGAIQHLAGIKDAGTIVAVNSDPDAPIFDVADLGLAGDLFEIIPQMLAALDT